MLILLPAPTNLVANPVLNFEDDVLGYPVSSFPFSFEFLE